MAQNNSFASGSEEKIFRIKLVYIFTYIGLSLLFLRVLYTYIMGSFFEQDLLWFIPIVFRSTDGASFWQRIGYYVNPFPLREAMPILKIYADSILSLFGPFTKYFIGVSIIFHFACSFLLYFLGKNLGLSSRISFFSGLIYLTLFAHLHAYMWPMAFMHLASIFFILLVLNLYLKTDNRIVNNLDFRRAYILTLLVNFLAPLCRLSVLSLPVMVITHILFCSRDKTEITRKYKIWMPLFATYLIYPLLLVSCGESRSQVVAAPLFNKFGFIFKNALLCSFFAKINVTEKFFILFIAGLFFLYIFKVLLAIYSNLSYKLGRALKTSFMTIIFLIFIMLIIDGGPKRLLIPYNMFLPFVGIMSTFLEPLRNALSINSVYPYYIIPLEINVFNFLLASFILFLFVKCFIFKQKQLVVLPVFYIFNLAYIYLRSAFPSRYFIYFTPVFCIIFCCVFDYIFSHYASQTKLKRAAKEIILCLVFVMLCIPNLLAIKLSLFRGLMSNSFLTYDYIRAANIIKLDLVKNREKIIYVDNIIPITFSALDDYTVTVASDPHDDNARFVFMQVFDNPGMNVKFNQGQHPRERGAVYSLDAYGIKNSRGTDISLFSYLFEEGRKKIIAKRYVEAEGLFMAAIKERPFLFNYILPGLNLDDLAWITDRVDTRAWLNKIGSFYSVGYDKISLSRNRYIFSIIDREVDDYAQCIFYISFLKHIAGDSNASRQWFLKIRFLESNFKKLASWLAELDLVKSDVQMQSFLSGLDNTSLYEAPDYYRGGYKFGKFLFKLALIDYK